jgi:hypothetical protein
MAVEGRSRLDVVVVMTRPPWRQGEWESLVGVQLERDVSRSSREGVQVITYASRSQRGVGHRAVQCPASRRTQSYPEVSSIQVLRLV